MLDYLAFITMPEKGVWGLDSSRPFNFKLNLLEGNQEPSIGELINLKLDSF